MSDVQEINIEEIIKEIRKEIKEKGYKESDLSFYSIPIPSQSVQNSQVNSNQDDLDNILNYLNANYLHDIMLPINSSNPVAAFVKKIIRKFVRFLFYPVLAQQNIVNGNIVNALNILQKRNEGNQVSEKTVLELQRRIQELEYEVERLKMRSGCDSL